MKNFFLCLYCCIVFQYEMIWKQLFLILYVPLERTFFIARLKETWITVVMLCWLSFCTLFFPLAVFILLFVFFLYVAFIVCFALYLALFTTEGEYYHSPPPGFASPSFFIFHFSSFLFFRVLFLGSSIGAIGGVLFCCIGFLVYCLFIFNV